MTFRTLITSELADLFGALSHRMRIRIIEELGSGEQDVNTLAAILNISHSGVSQHLAILRAHKLVIERKQGRKVFYRLKDEQLAAWALDGLRFVGPEQGEVNEFFSAVEKARHVWSRQNAESS